MRPRNCDHQLPSRPEPPCGAPLHSYEFLRKPRGQPVECRTARLWGQETVTTNFHHVLSHLVVHRSIHMSSLENQEANQLSAERLDCEAKKLWPPTSITSWTTSWLREPVLPYTSSSARVDSTWGVCSNIQTKCAKERILMMDPLFFFLDRLPQSHFKCLAINDLDLSEQPFL